MWCSVGKVDVAEQSDGDADGGAIHSRDDELGEFGEGLRREGGKGGKEGGRGGERQCTPNQSKGARTLTFMKIAAGEDSIL